MSESLVGEGKKAASKEREWLGAKDGGWCGNGDIVLSGRSVHRAARAQEVRSSGQGV